MKKRKAPDSYAELVNVISKFLYGDIPEAPEDIDEALREVGFDPAEFSSRMGSVAEKALSDSPLNWRVSAPKEIELATEKLKGVSLTSGLDRSEIIEEIKKIIDLLGGEQQMQAFAHHRNLESATDDDLASLLEDLQFLSHPKNEDESS